MAKRTRPHEDQLALDLRVKLCRDCNRELPGWDFVQHKRSKIGLASYCLKCSRARYAAYYADPEFRRRELARRKLEMQDPKARARANQRSAAWYKANADRRKALGKAWSRANRDKHRQLVSAWAKAHPEAVRAIGNRYYARKNTAKSFPFTPLELAQRWAYFGGKCWICGDDATATDHVKPLAKGGAHMLCNLRPICTPCNSSKRDKWPYPVEGNHSGVA